ncbi:MAG: hypothetical protein KAR13_19085 [Desulfobulbaceae bacterium]|nr:hypothetical protein [Desulfobulbaceae bacterium]
MEYKNLDPGTQFKIFDRVCFQMENFTNQDAKNGAMVWLMNIVNEETKIAQRENAEKK